MSTVACCTSKLVSLAGTLHALPSGLSFTQEQTSYSSPIWIPGIFLKSIITNFVTPLVLGGFAWAIAELWCPSIVI